MASSFEEGPTMLVLTAVLSPEPPRWGKFIVTLPRPVSVKKLLAGSVGALLGGGLGFLVRGFSGFLYGALILGFLGVLFVSYSPLRGETLTKWLGLAWKNRRQQQFTIDGKTAAYSIGICPIPLPDSSLLHLVPGSIPVAPGIVDERGTLRHENNFNLLNDQESHAFPQSSARTAKSAKYDWDTPSTYDSSSAPYQPWTEPSQSLEQPPQESSWTSPREPHPSASPWVSAKESYPQRDDSVQSWDKVSAEDPWISTEDLYSQKDSDSTP